MAAPVKRGLGDSVFLVKTLEKILNDKETKRSQHQRLRRACEDALKEIKEEQKKPKGQAESQSDPGTINADKYFLPLELAFRSNIPRVVNVSLDCVQKLVAYGLLKGESVDPDNPDKHLIDRIIDTICGCFVGVQTDEGVQLQIIKALLTILTSNNVEVHGGTVLQAVRCCYNIFLASRSSINQTTAKASLTQIISTLFQNLENEESLQAMARERMAMSYPTPPPSRSDNQSDTSSLSHDRIPDLVEQEDRRQDIHKQDPELAAIASKLVEQVLAKVVAEECMKIPSSHVEERKTEGEKDELSSEFTVSIASTTASAFDDDDSTLSEVRDPSPHPQAPAIIKGNLQFRHILQKDCFLVFRTLCKLSMKNVTDIHDPRSHELRSKVISLELLLSILENSGPVFRTDEVFIGAIKHHLCVALSKNGVSSVPEVFELSLSIFLALFLSFKAHLKMQIEVFFKEIFLNILETSTSSFQLKWLVLQALMRVCNDAQSIVDIYLNYDCDFSLANIYGRLVNDLSRIGQGRQAVELGATPLQERKIRVKGLECLVSILKCLVEWSRELYIDPSTTGLNAVSPITGGGSGVGPTQHSLNHTLGKNVKRNKVTQPNPNAETEGTSISEGTMATDSPEQFETQKLMKETMERGIKLFVDKPKKGIAFLQENGILGNKPEDIAKLFYTDERFDKTAVGDYMGEGDEFNKAVMYAYIDCFDFSDIAFVPALRLLLSSFRLPGEAQKIDRIMEKFASRYCETNPSLGIFASADTAYVLAYSIIMLTTDLHSSQVKRKMTKEDYIRMNRGINDSKDLPREYLEDIYDEIASSEIKLKTSLESRQSLTRQSMIGVSEKQRRQAYYQEMSVMAETAQALMEHISDKQAQFTSATHVEHVKSMFKVAWTPVLAALSVALRDTDDPEVVSLCLDGFRCAIRVACIFGLNLERDAYIKSLAKFTMLMTSTGITEMKVKNIEVIKTLCTVAYTDGNYLQSSWIDVLQCISQLELAQLIGSGVKTRYLTSVHPTTTKGGSTSGSTRGSSIDNILMGTDTKKIASILESVEGTSNQRVVVAVDRIFTGTTRLDGAAIVEFVEALCAVSDEELSSPAHARMFSLQKIIELSYYNMERIRLEMSRIWEVIGAHFNTVGCLPNEEVSFFVVDSLRQLSMKFVEKKELANFRFQKDFLRPFEYIMKRNESVTIRDMVVRCVAQIIQAKAQNIVSGWKNIFSVFLLAAGDHDQTIVELSFQTTSSIFEKYFEATIDSFQDAIKCLAEFACNASYPDTSMEAIRIIRICAKHVAERPELFHVAEEGVVVDSDRIWVKAWFPIMFELSTIISRCKLDVRTRGLTVMFEIMKTYGHLYHQHWWTDLFNVVFRLFGNMKFPDSPIEKAEWMTTTCNHALYALMDVFTQFFDRLCPVLLGDILSQLLWCVQQDNEQLARSGTNCLENLVISVGKQFTEDIWDKICQCVLDIYKASIPEELNTWRPTEDHPSQSNLSIASSHSSLVSDTVIIHQTPSPQDPHSAPPSVVPPVMGGNPLTQDRPNTVEVITGADTPDDNPFQPPLSDTITEPLPAPPDIHISRPSVDLTDINESNQLQEQIHPVSQKPSVVHDQISSDVVQEDIQLTTTKSATPPATMTQTVDITDKSKPVSRPKASSVSSSRDDNKRRSLIRPRKDKEEKSRNKSKKKDKKKGQNKEKASSVDETPSELSYNHPDTDMTLAKSRTQRLSVFSPEHSLFNSLAIKCVVQLELINAVGNIIFHLTVTRQDDHNILNAAGVMSIHYPLPLPPYSDRDMFQYLSTTQLFILLDCLEQSHMFARSFNSNHNQRIVLMKAGFLGRSKPNLLLQETSSLLTGLRILYRMLGDKSRENEYYNIENRLLELVTSALTYFLTLTLDSHRSSWTPVLLLIFTRMLQITVDEFKRHMAVCYPHLCELISLELKYEVRCLLRRVFTRIGSEFSICSFSEIN